MFKTQFKLSFLKPFTGGTKCLVLLGFYSFYFIEFLHKAAYTSRFKISNLWCSDYQKIYSQVKKIKSRHFHLCFPLGRGKLLIAPRQHFFKNPFSPHKKLGRILHSLIKRMHFNRTFKQRDVLLNNTGFNKGPKGENF